MQTPDQQISLTDPDARSMATSGRGTGIVGYNVQTVVDTQHHMIVAHEVTNVGHDRTQLTDMATAARDAIGHQEMTALADRGYFKGEEILQCEEAGIKPLVPKPLTSGSKADGRFDKRDFIYDSKRDEYRCPAGERAIWRQTTIEKGHDPAPVLAIRLPALPDQVAMHDRRLPPRHAVGARAGIGGHAAPPGPHAGSIATTPADGRTPLRDAEGVDGLDPLPHQDPAAGPNGNELARPGLQLEADAADLRHADAGCLHQGIGHRGKLPPAPFCNPCAVWHRN